MKLRIRKSEFDDLAKIMEIYAFARDFMAKNGNPNQWGPTCWPPEALIRQDIENGHSYVCVNEKEEIIATFFFNQGKDIEPTYKNISQGSWKDSSPYGVVHRIAANGREKGTGSFCMNWALEKCPHLRIDTHPDNKVMQNMLKKLGFEQCGIIHVEEDSYPRLAYEKSVSLP